MYKMIQLLIVNDKAKYFHLKVPYEQRKRVLPISGKYWNPQAKAWAIPFSSFMSTIVEFPEAYIEPGLQELIHEFEVEQEELKKEYEREEELRKAKNKALAEAHPELIVCPKCGSPKIFNLRIDSDWSSAGSYYAENAGNDLDIYTRAELRYDSGDRPDLALRHCRDCDHIWDY